MITAELAKAIEAEIAQVDEKINALRTSIADCESYRVRLSEFGKGELDRTPVPGVPEKPRPKKAAVNPPPSTPNPQAACEVGAR